MVLIKNALLCSATRWEHRLANDGKKTPATPKKILLILLMTKNDADLSQYFRILMVENSVT